MHYRPEIDGLRAIAVSAVIAAHAGAPLAGGYLGVDLFFVISGFLITSILLRETGRGAFSLMRFYERRARRILPALFSVTLACLPAAWVLMTPDQFKAFGQGLVALSVFASNILFAHKAGYFAPASDENPLIHTWSLGVEEQFYLLFPLALVVLHRRGARVWVWMAGAALTSLVAANIAARTAPDMAFYLLPFRAWELLAGVLAALALRAGSVAPLARIRLWPGGARAGPVLALLGLGLIGFALSVLHPGLPVAGGLALIPVTGAVLVILFATPATLVGRLLGLPPLVGLGLISYSAYLWHQPLFAFARLALLDPPTPLLMAGLTGLTLALAWLTWMLIERPFRDASRWRPGPLAAGAGALSAAFIAFGLGLHVANGLGPQRYAPETAALFQTAKPVGNRADCHGPPAPSARPETACTTNATDRPTWAVFGDSHAVELAQALGAELHKAGQGAIQFSASGCPPALGFATDMAHCADWVRRHTEWLERADSVETVLLVWRHSAYLFGKNEHLYPALPDRPYRIAVAGEVADQRLVYWRAFSRIVERLRQGGRHVVVLAPVPEIARGIGKYIHRADNHAGDLATVPRTYYEARNAWVLDKLSGLAGPGVEIVYPADVLCDARICYGARDGAAFYFDDNHLSMAGAGRVIAHLLGQPRPDRTAAARPVTTGAR